MNPELHNDAAVAEPTDDGDARRRRAAAIACLLLVVALFGGVVSAVRSSLVATPRITTMSTARDAAPISLESLRPAVAAMYRHAAGHEDVYHRVPCYCGCESFADHRNLFDCFVRADGAGYDAHGSGCAICQAEAREVRRLNDSGRSPAQIRAHIIDLFGPDTERTGTSDT